MRNPEKERKEGEEGKDREGERERGGFCCLLSILGFVIHSDDVDQLQPLAESQQCQVAARGGVQTSIFVAQEAAGAAQACCRRLSLCCGVGLAPWDPLRGCVRGLPDSSGLLISQISVWPVGNLGFGFVWDVGGAKNTKLFIFFFFLIFLAQFS